MIAGSNGMHGSAGLDAFDELADAFLGGPAGSGVSGSGGDSAFLPPVKTGENVASAVAVRVLLQGHLPGRASLWAGPAVQAMADHHGQPLLLVRLAGADLGDAQVDLVRPAIDGRGMPIDTAGPSIAVDAESGDFASAIQAGLREAAGVVVCVGGEDLSSKQAALLLSLDRLIKQGQCEVTVLTGADDASAIAAYKLMKTVAESLGGRVHGLDQATGPANLRMSVCLAGTSAARADEAFARMADASRQFLASTLGRGVDVPKLTGLHSMSLHDRVSEHVVLEARLEQLREQLTSWIATRNTTAHTVPVASAAATTQTTGTQTTGSMHPSPLSPYSSHTPAAEPMNKSTPAATHLSVVGRPVEWAGHLDVSSGEPMAQVKLVMDDRGMMRPAAKHVAPQTVSQGLVVDGPAAVVRDESPATRATAPVAAPAGTMMFPGLTALSFRCPFEKSAILAIDEAGVLQVMVSHAGGPELGRDAAASKQAVAEATHRLITVGGWLSANGELLNLIAGGKINTAAKPVLHLLTDQPSCVRRLLDTEIRVHLVVDEAKLKQGAMAIALN